MGILVSKLTMNEQCICMAKVAKLGCTNTCITSGWGRWSSPSAPVRQHLECCVHFWAPYCRRGWCTRVSPSGAAEMVGDWNMWQKRRCSDKRVCSAHRGGGYGRILLLPATNWWAPTEAARLSSGRKDKVIDMSCSCGGKSNHILGKGFITGSQTQEHISWRVCENPILRNVHISAGKDLERPYQNSKLHLASEFALL